MSLNVHTQTIGKHLLVRIGGAVDLETAPRLTHVLVDAAASTPNAPGMIIDLTHTTFFGASGLTVLARVASHRHDSGFSLAVIAPRHGIVRRVIAITQLMDMAPVTDTVLEAQRLLQAHHAGKWSALPRSRRFPDVLRPAP